MTWLELLVSIWGGTYVPRTKGPPPPDRAEGYGWAFGALILVAAVVYALVKIIAY